MSAPISTRRAEMASEDSVGLFHDQGFVVLPSVLRVHLF